MHVLIIEDDLLIALDVQACLEKMGATSTEMASSEDHAVRSARRRRPDLIASDVRLAQGNGPGAVQRIQTEHGPIPVIYITATPEIAHSMHPGSHVLTKPLQWQALEEAGRALAFGMQNKIATVGARPIEEISHDGVQ
jgi:DNA-binding NtrC family response regulator